MWNKIKNSKWLYVLLSILMAVILWAYVVKEADPDLTKDVAGIPVTFTGTGILNSRNLIIAAVILVCGLGFTGGLTFHIGEVSITLTSLAIAAIAGIALNAILPGNDFRFGKTATSDTAASLGRY